MNTEELLTEYRNKIEIKFSELKELSKLWKLYQKGDYDRMIKAAEKLNDRFPFLMNAVKAHKNRLPQNGHSGRPTQTLIQIMDEFKTKEFDPIFKEFCIREEIYGFGDLQVKRLLNEINNKH